MGSMKAGNIIYNRHTHTIRVCIYYIYIYAVLYLFRVFKTVQYVVHKRSYVMYNTLRR